MADKDLTKRIIDSFKKYDKNGDGKITKPELKAVMQKLSPDLKDKQLDALMTEIDADQNGSISSEEWVQWIMQGESVPDKLRDEVNFDKKARPNAKKKPAAKVKAKAKALTKAQTKEELFKEDKEGKEKLDKLLDEVFKCYDSDQDGQIERVELLEGEEKRRGKFDFGPKQRKELINWFKEAGAEGNPSDGMYLSPEKWKIAYLRDAVKDSEIPETEPAKLAEWIYENQAKALIDACYVAPPASSVPAGSNGAPSKPAPPEYPLTIEFTELAEKLNEARACGRMALVCASGVAEVETFITYRNFLSIDCKQVLNECLIKKSKTKEAAQAEMRQTLENCMGSSNSMGFCKPLHIRLSNSAFDFTAFCGDTFPAEVFSGSLWTLDLALTKGVISESAKINLEIEDEKKFKEFHVVITSMFDLEKANEHLFDKIPHYDELAILIVDPKSVA